MEDKCKCHGVSGSCAIKTCWKEVPDLQAIGGALHKKYRKAKLVKVTATDRADKMKLELTDSERNGTPQEDDLVFEDESPLYCRQSRRSFYEGTVGRACNATSAGFDGCRYVCCGRGYDRLVVNEEYDCHCEFVWCCKVSCQTCTRKRLVQVCK